MFDPVPRYMRNGRDIGQWVHIDVLFQAYFQAFLVLAGAGAPFDDGNPYNGNPSQMGFGTFGGPHIATLLCEVSTRALKAVWYQKWFVHRRLRPEVHAERVHRTLFDGAGYPVHPEILNSFNDNNRLKGFVRFLKARRHIRLTALDTQPLRARASRFSRRGLTKLQGSSISVSLQCNRPMMV
jgi:hypothetical protein